MGYIHGAMEDNTQANGWIIKCMVREFLNGLRVKNMKDNINMIKKMVMVNWTTPMAQYIEVNGKMENNMVMDKYNLLIIG